MKKNERNEELQSRREFFKKAAKGALPILGAMVLANTPLLSQAAKETPSGCQYSCSAGCLNNCYGSCSGSCRGTCSGNCFQTCQGSCSGSCYRGCTGCRGLNYGKY